MSLIFLSHQLLVKAKNHHRETSVVQRRNKGGAIPQAPNHYGGAESLWVRRKVPTMSQLLCSTAHLLPKDLRFEHGGAKLVSCTERHLTSLRLCPHLSTAEVNLLSQACFTQLQQVVVD